MWRVLVAGADWITLTCSCRSVKTQTLPGSCMLMSLYEFLVCTVHRIVPVWFLVGACVKVILHAAD